VQQMTFDEIINTIIVTVIGAISTAGTWLVRTVLTNQKQITLLQEEICTRDERREEDRTMWKELKDDVKDFLK
jgi:hypothetical protein